MTRIPYDDTKMALFHPEQAHPPLFSAEHQPKDEVTLALEAARLAYFRFESSNGDKGKLEAALRSVGFEEIKYFNDALPRWENLLQAGGPMQLQDMKLSELKKLLPKSVVLPDFGLGSLIDPRLRSLSDLLQETVIALVALCLSQLAASPRNTHTQGFAAYRKKDQLALLAFRGTQADAPADLLLDAMFLPLQAKGWPGLLHHGFAQGTAAVFPAVERWLARHADRARLLVCGHSLGAAIATLVAVRYPGPATRLVTMGSPRVGDNTFAQAFAASGVRATRVVNSLDVVTRVPPSNFIVAYRHVGTATFIDSSGKLVSNPTPAQVDGDVAPAGLSDYKAISGLQLPCELSDHAPINYLRPFWS